MGVRRPPREIPDLDAYYVETATSRRLRAVFDDAMKKRTWHLVYGLTGIGKSTEIDEYEQRYPIARHADGTTEAPVLSGSPIGHSKGSVKAFGRTFIDSLGTVPAKTQAEDELYLANQIVACKTQVLVTDEAHTCTSDELLWLKRVTDLATKKRHGQKVAVVFVCTGLRGHTPLREVIDRPTVQWSQFRKRMSPTTPYTYIAGLNAEELRAVLRAYERSVVGPFFPHLNLVRWATTMHRALQNPFFDLDSTERVTMQNVRNVVDGILHRLVERDLEDVPGGTAGQHLIAEVVAELLDAPNEKVSDADPGAAEEIADGAGRSATALRSAEGAT